MIRFFRRNERAVYYMFIFLAAVLMVSFGMDFTSGGRKGLRGSSRHDAAILVDDTEITHQEFYDKKREVENRYRQMFGPQYEALAKQFNLNVPQNVVDGMIENALLVSDARKRGFEASDEEVIAAFTKMFPGGYDPSMERLLDETEKSIVRANLEEPLQDSANASQREARAVWIKNNTIYNVSYIELDPKNYLGSVQTPSDEQLKTFYDDHSEEFKLPARASYEYVAFKPENFLKEIDIPQDEIEFYYTDNQSKFENPEQLKLKHIQFLYPKESDPKKMDEVRQKATEVYEKAKGGEAFNALVQKFSDDYTTRSSNGDLGWVPKGRYSKIFDEKTYAVKNGGLADLIETDYGFHIVQVEGYKESSLKPLASVQDEIREVLKKEQAPAYADTKGREFFDLVTSSEKPLTELAKEKGYTAAVTNGFLSETNDPDPALKGLSAKVIEDSIDLKQYVELKDIGVVVSLKEAKEPEVPALETIKDRVLAQYKTAQSITAARTQADAILKKLREEKKSLDEVAKGEKVSVQTKTGLKASAALPAPLNGQGFSEEIFSAESVPSTPSKVLSSQGKLYVIQATSRTLPDISTAKPEELITARQQQSDMLAQLSTKGYAEALKASAKIDVDPAILHGESESE